MWVSWWGGSTLRPDVVKTITKLFTFILMLFLDFWFFSSRREISIFYVQIRGKQIFVNKIGDCATLCFVLFFIGHLSLKEDFTSLPCLPKLGHVTCLGQWTMSRTFNSHKWFSCALLALCHEFSYIRLGVLHQPGSYSKDHMEVGFSQPVMDLLPKSEMNLCCYKPMSFWSLCCLNIIFPELTDMAFLPPLEFC